MAWLACPTPFFEQFPLLEMEFPGKSGGTVINHDVQHLQQLVLRVAHRGAESRLHERLEKLLKAG